MRKLDSSNGRNGCLRHSQGAGRRVAPTSFDSLILHTKRNRNQNQSNFQSKSSLLSLRATRQFYYYVKTLHSIVSSIDRKECELASCTAPPRLDSGARSTTFGRELEAQDDFCVRSIRDEAGPGPPHATTNHAGSTVYDDLDDRASEEEPHDDFFFFPGEEQFGRQYYWRCYVTGRSGTSGIAADYRRLE